jgi:hypothetical protein
MYLCTDEEPREFMMVFFEEFWVKSEDDRKMPSG